MPILEGKGATRYFGGLAAVSNVNFKVAQNVRHTLEVSDRAYVIENGHIVLAGESEKFNYSKTKNKRTL